MPSTPGPCTCWGSMANPVLRAGDVCDLPLLWRTCYSVCVGSVRVLCSGPSAVALAGAPEEALEPGRPLEAVVL